MKLRGEDVHLTISDGIRFTFGVFIGTFLWTTAIFLVFYILKLLGVGINI